MCSSRFRPWPLPENSARPNSPTAYRRGRRRRGCRATAPAIRTVLYFIGGGVVVMGIVALIAQMWNDLGSVTRVVVSLGSGIAAFTAGVLLSRRQWLGAAGPGILSHRRPGAALRAGRDPGRGRIAGRSALQWQSLISVVLMGAFPAAYLLFRSNSLLLYAIGFATWAFFAITGWIAGPNPGFDGFAFFEYRALAVGLSYLLLAFPLPRRPAPSALRLPLWSRGR